MSALDEDHECCVECGRHLYEIPREYHSADGTWSFCSDVCLVRWLKGRNEWP